MVLDGVRIDNIDLKTFNSLHDINIKRDMGVEEVHMQLESVDTISCGFVAKNEDKAMRAVLRGSNEYIINVENIFYLCVKDVKKGDI